jgi:hypothetical protein
MQRWPIYVVLFAVFVPAAYFGGHWLEDKRTEVLFHDLREMESRDFAAGYGELRDGMNLFAANALLGREGSEVASAGRVKEYVWRDGGRSIRATFHGGRLVAKSQEGL